MAVEVKRLGSKGLSMQTENKYVLPNYRGCWMYTPYYAGWPHCCGRSCSHRTWYSYLKMSKCI